MLLLLGQLLMLLYCYGYFLALLSLAAHYSHTWCEHSNECSLSVCVSYAYANADVNSMLGMLMPQHVVINFGHKSFAICGDLSTDGHKTAALATLQLEESQSRDKLHRSTAPLLHRQHRLNPSNWACRISTSMPALDSRPLITTYQINYSPGRQLRAAHKTFALQLSLAGCSRRAAQLCPAGGAIFLLYLRSSSAKKLTSRCHLPALPQSRLSASESWAKVLGAAFTGTAPPRLSATAPLAPSDGHVTRLEVFYVQSIEMISDIEINCVLSER